MLSVPSTISLSSLSVKILWQKGARQKRSDLLNKQGDGIKIFSLFLAGIPHTARVRFQTNTATVDLAQALALVLINKNAIKHIFFYQKEFFKGIPPEHTVYSQQLKKHLRMGNFLLLSSFRPHSRCFTFSFYLLVVPKAGCYAKVIEEKQNFVLNPTCIIREKKI